MFGISTQEYCAALEHGGTKIFPGSRGSFWLRSEWGAFERHPVFGVEVPEAAEINRIFWKNWTLVVSYLLPADSGHPANAWLYVCADKNYELEKLGTQARRNIRRALRRFRFEYCDVETLRTNGEHIFCQTRSRVGLSDGTTQNFKRLCDSVAKNPGYRILAAWDGEVMAAYMLAICVEDWITFSAYAGNDHLNSCPNEGMIFHIMQQFFRDGNGSIVSYGLSSIQDADNVVTLDYFKKKVGFEARPVHRVFVFHPLIRPLINPISYWVVRKLAALWPRNRLLRKGLGLIAIQLGYNRPLSDGPPAQSDGTPDRD